ncbi:MAG: UDP-N-acetylmuramate--L-alanine ligase [Acidobacteria bacterium]|nr:UDP-N-acetylmuramate--L-alanine ligase [Acidobacteriota bacterium]
MAGPATFAVVTGGGTRGHVVPALALLELLVDAGYDASQLHYVGSAAGVEAAMVPAEGFGCTLLRVGGLRRSLRPGALLRNVRLPFTVLRATSEARRLLRRLRPAVVVSVGGYASVPACRAATRLGIPVVTCSYDRTPGLATRVQARTAAASAVAYLPSGLPNAVPTGAPVRREVRALDAASRRAPARAGLGLPADGTVVSVVGGSLGSALLNEVAVRLIGCGATVLHLCGDRYAATISAPETAHGEDGRLLYRRMPSTESMADVYAASDLVVCRSGASTIAEVSAIGVASVQVPWRGAAGDHQVVNARTLGDAGAAVVVDDESVHSVVGQVGRLLADPGARTALALGARAAGALHRRPRFVEVLESAVHGASPTDLARPRTVHVLGVAGPGMGALAAVSAGMGHRTSGCDVRTVEGGIDGVPLLVGNDASHVQSSDVVAYSSAISALHPELVAARRAGASPLIRASFLASVCALRDSVGVAGTHGKTTTTAMLATILRDAGLEPGWLVGGDPRGLGASARWGSGRHFVIEADESDGTHLRLPLAAAIVTNVDVDHVDRYGSFGAIVDAFERFADGVRGPVVACADDDACAAIARRVRTASTYGTTAASDWLVGDVRPLSDGMSFSLRGPDGTVLRAAIPVRGAHNVLNASAAIAMASALGADAGGAAASLERFAGVGRRFDVRGSAAGITFVDDYAHLPREIDAVLSACRNGDGRWSRIVAVFQPNRYNRMSSMSPAYADAFVAADVVVVTDIYASGTERIPGVTGELVASAIRERHPSAQVAYIPSRADLATGVAALLRPGDVCVSMGCGDIEHLPGELLSLFGSAGA